MTKKSPGTSGREDWIFSVDDHVFEPPDLWSSRLPAKYRDIGPRLQKIDGVDTWVYEDTHVAMTGISAVVGKPRSDWDAGAINYDDLHPACWQPLERVKLMDEAGILVQTPFPQYPRFCGQIFKEAEDKEFALLCVQAWNDFMIDEWAGSAPGRFMPLAMVPLWDATLAAKEATRAIEKGARGIIFSENAADLGLPSIHNRDDYWNPLFSVANDSGLPVCMHTGSSSRIDSTAPDAPFFLLMTLAIRNSYSALCDWLVSGQFFKHPNLKIVLSEGGIGWMPFVLTWMDRQAERNKWAENTDFNFDMAAGNYSARPSTHKIMDSDYPPSVLFREHVYGCFIEDPMGTRNIEFLGTDNVLMETDFPHSDGSWPDSFDMAHEALAAFDDIDRRKILNGNASRLFQFDPFDPSTLSRGGLSAVAGQ